MKKVIYVTLLIIVIPYLVINLFVRDDEIKFKFVSNMFVRVKHEDTGVIEKVPFEEYITGVLAGEMPVTFELEALKAQAVAARSYVMKRMAYNKDKDYDVVDTVMNQVYLTDEYLKSVWKDKYVEKINKIKTAVVETKGEYLDYEGQVVDAFFFSTSVGATENSEDVFTAEIPYLRSVTSTWDEEVSPVYEEVNNFTLKEFYEKLGVSYQDEIKLDILKTTSTGRIKEIKINGNKFTGGEVMNKLKIRSAFFTIVQNGEKVVVTTKGYGHGVGMSQYGAQAMALKKYTYDEILKHYYSGVTIKKI